MKTYKIGEIAKLLGISAETVRNYEKKGLIHPYKEEETQYRYYDIIQINHLLNLQKFQKYGYHLNEIKDIMNYKTMEDIEMSLVKREQDLVNEAFLLNLKLNSIHTTISSILQAKSAKEGCILGERPALYRLQYQKNLELLQDERIQKEMVKWLRYADLPFMSASISKESLENLQEEFNFGFCLNQRTAEFLGIQQNDVVEFYDRCPAIILYYEANEKTDIVKVLKRLQDFVKEQNLRIVGDSVSKVIFARWINETEYMISHLVWIPYEHKDNKK